MQLDSRDKHVTLDYVEERLIQLISCLLVVVFCVSLSSTNLRTIYIQFRREGGTLSSRIPILQRF